MELMRKLEILADAAKYDASCASSGTEMRDSSDGLGLGSTVSGMGICHSPTTEPGSGVASSHENLLEPRDPLGG